MNSNTHHKRNLLPLLGDALWLLTGTDTTKDVNSIKAHVNQLTQTQSTQQDTLVHIASILNVTRYAAKVNRHGINVIMDKADETSKDVNNLYNFTTSLAISLSYHQLVLYIRWVLANLWDSLSYITTVYYIHHKLLRCSYNRNTFSTCSTNNGSVIPCRGNTTIYLTSPSHLKIPCISIDYPEFLWYLCTHVLISNKQFLLLINIPIQNWSQQLSI